MDAIMIFKNLVVTARIIFAVKRTDSFLSDSLVSVDVLGIDTVKLSTTLLWLVTAERLTLR